MTDSDAILYDERGQAAVDPWFPVLPVLLGMVGFIVADELGLGLLGASAVAVAHFMVTSGGYYAFVKGMQRLQAWRTA